MERRLPRVSTSKTLLPASPPPLSTLSPSKPCHSEFLNSQLDAESHRPARQRLSAQHLFSRHSGLRIFSLVSSLRDRRVDQRECCAPETLTKAMDHTLVPYNTTGSTIRLPKA